MKAWPLFLPNLAVTFHKSEALSTCAVQNVAARISTCELAHPAGGHPPQPFRIVPREKRNMGVISSSADIIYNNGPLFHVNTFPRSINVITIYCI